MPITDSFSPQPASFDWAIVAATISILLGGILFGTGIGLRFARLRLFGQEELAQGIISAAMVGGIFAFCSALSVAASGIVPSSGWPPCPSAANVAGTPFGFYECHLEAMSASYSELSSSLQRSSTITGFASSLKITEGNVSAQPLFALEESSRSLSEESRVANGIAALAHSELLVADVVRSSALVLFLPIGLLLRSFFATRKLGAAAMAIAVSAFMVYPLLFIHTFPAGKSAQAAANATIASGNFNAAFASIPSLELGSAAGVRDRIDEISGGDFESRLQGMLSGSAGANAQAASDLAVFPLISLIVSAVAALEMYLIFSANIFVPYFETV